MSKQTEGIKSHLYCNGFLGAIDKLFEDKDGVHIRVITDYEGHKRLQSLMAKIFYDLVEMDVERSDMDFFRATHHYCKKPQENNE